MIVSIVRTHNISSHHTRYMVQPYSRTGTLVHTSFTTIAFSTLVHSFWYLLYMQRHTVRIQFITGTYITLQSIHAAHTVRHTVHKEFIRRIKRYIQFIQCIHRVPDGSAVCMAVAVKPYKAVIDRLAKLYAVSCSCKAGCKL
jgi:hypothetical protein